jgi:hypothetical protein
MTIARELDAAKAHITELEAAQPDRGSLFNLDLKNDKPDNIGRGDHRQRRPWPGREDRSCDSKGGQIEGSGGHAMARRGPVGGPVTAAAGPMEQPQSIVKVGPDPPWGVGGTLDRGRAPWGSERSL